MKGWGLCLPEEERKEGEKSPSLISCLRFCRLERLEEGELPLKLGEAEHSSLCYHCSFSSGSFLFPVILDWEPTLRMLKHPMLGCQWCFHGRVQTEPCLMAWNCPWQGGKQVAVLEKYSIGQSPSVSLWMENMLPSLGSLPRSLGPARTDGSRHLVVSY